MQYLQGWNGNKKKNMANIMPLSNDIQRMPKNCNHPSLLQHELQIVSYTCVCHWQQFQCPWPARRTDTTQRGGEGHSTQFKTNVQTGRNPTASHSPWAKARLTWWKDVKGILWSDMFYGHVYSINSIRLLTCPKNLKKSSRVHEFWGHFKRRNLVLGNGIGPLESNHRDGKIYNNI